MTVIAWKFNLNDQAYAILTETGAKAWNRYHEVYPHWKPVKAGDEVREQLWCWFAVLGPKCLNGAQLVEGNTINIEPTCSGGAGEPVIPG